MSLLKSYQLSFDFFKKKILTLLFALTIVSQLRSSSSCWGSAECGNQIAKCNRVVDCCAEQNLSCWLHTSGEPMADACCLQRSQLQSDGKGTCLWQLTSASTEKSNRRLSQVIWDTFLTPKQRDRIYLHDRLLAQVYFSSPSACPSCKTNQIDFRNCKEPI